MFLTLLLWCSLLQNPEMVSTLFDTFLSSNASNDNVMAPVNIIVAFYSHWPPYYSLSLCENGNSCNIWAEASLVDELLCYWSWLYMLQGNKVFLSAKSFAILLFYSIAQCGFFPKVLTTSKLWKIEYNALVYWTRRWTWIFFLTGQ